MEYPLLKNEKQIGKVTVEKIGLYLEIKCSCSNLESGFHRLHMVYQDKTISLGVFVLENGCYNICKKIPQKSVGEGIPKFRIASDADEPSEQCVQLLTGQALDKLEWIRTWRLRTKEGGAYIAINSKNHME